MTYRHERIVGWTTLTIIVLWFFAAPFLFFYGMKLLHEPGEQLSLTELLYSIFFFGTWGWSAFVVYVAFFAMTIPRWPWTRKLAEIIAYIVIILIFAFMGQSYS
ncbi:hypothetical protein [Bradyrhizobium prioriisuperbiae]|uniref:hypothetical protein n=1 Tax=Bradyrhizobium prioriisuperbiae TaxID=2854389 RepID=UPI0028E90BD9|nr:hypothetical protein [Bradyrhizobium prioritasuperba]